MLHTKFCGNWSTDSGEKDFLRVFTINGRGGHLGHVTQMLRTNFRSPYDGRMTMDGRTPDHGYTISSPLSLRLRLAHKGEDKLCYILLLTSAFVFTTYIDSTIPLLPKSESSRL